MVNSYKFLNLFLKFRNTIIFLTVLLLKFRKILIFDSLLCLDINKLQ